MWMEGGEVDGDRIVVGGCVVWDVVGEAAVAGMIAGLGGVCWRERTLC